MSNESVKYACVLGFGVILVSCVHDYVSAKLYTYTKEKKEANTNIKYTYQPIHPSFYSPFLLNDENNRIPWYRFKENPLCARTLFGNIYKSSNKYSSPTLQQSDDKQKEDSELFPKELD